MGSFRQLQLLVHDDVRAVPDVFAHGCADQLFNDGTDWRSFVTIHLAIGENFGILVFIYL